LPEIDERLHLVKVHEGNVINMSVSLSLKHDSRRKTLFTHALGEGLVIGAVVIHFIAELGEGDAVLTLLIWLMFTLALGFDF